MSGLDLEAAYHRMALIREFELNLVELYGHKQVRGTAHPYIGMEAIAVGACSVLGSGDYIVSNHRGHGHSLAKGLDPARMMAEILGRETGYCRGRGGSMHITAIEEGMLGADGVVGGGLGLVVGAAHVLKLRGEGGMAVVFFGDGASNEGLFHEAANLAAVLAAPVVFLCENNHWAVSTRTARAVSVEHIADRAAAYGFPGVTVDGNDVEAVYEAMVSAAERARAGDGPTLLEADTYRMTLHSLYSSTADDRPAEELEHWRARDPIPALERRMTEAGDATAARLAELYADAKEVIAQAVQFGLDSAMPDETTVDDNVYAPASLGMSAREQTMVGALNEALHQEMTRDESVLMIGKDIGESGGLFGVSAGLQTTFGPDRVIDSPISEAAIAGFGIGAALLGHRPVVEFQVFDFVSLAMDQIVNHAAKWRFMSGGQVTVPVVFRGPTLSGTGVAAQHSQALEAGSPASPAWWSSRPPRR